MFAGFGTVTDCSLKFTKDGKFRKFGFVGFKAEEDANRALKHFDKSFVDTSRVTVWLQSRALFTVLVCFPPVNAMFNVMYSRWRCVRPLETPLKQKPGANTARAQPRRNPPLLLILTAKRYLHTLNDRREVTGEPLHDHHKATILYSHIHHVQLCPTIIFSMLLSG